MAVREEYSVLCGAAWLRRKTLSCSISFLVGPFASVSYVYTYIVLGWALLIGLSVCLYVSLPVPTITLRRRGGAPGQGTPRKKAGSPEPGSLRQ